jgi:hypothetical protein
MKFSNHIKVGGLDAYFQPVGTADFMQVREKRERSSKCFVKIRQRYAAFPDFFIQSRFTVFQLPVRFEKVRI